ncbi:MAG: HNH endonuclease [Clostridia bacterium]|nr:HNH endonuclease [Clostridia bacterium]
MMKDYAKQFYKSKKWQKCRQSFIESRKGIDGGLCQHCHSNYGYIVHHKVHITPQNINNPDVTLNFDNLEFVCHECHNKEHFGEKMRVKFSPDGRILPP